MWLKDERLFTQIAKDEEQKSLVVVNIITLLYKNPVLFIRIMKGNPLLGVQIHGKV